MKNSPMILILCILFLMVSSAVSLAQTEDLVGWYFPVNLGATWTYADQINPGNYFTESVFEALFYEGHQAYRLGEGPDEHVIVGREGGVLTVYAVVEDGIQYDLPIDLVLGEFTDGSTFEVCFDFPCDTSLIRVWQVIDPALRSVYGLDPSWTDMIMIAGFDPDYPPNLHNVVVASNLPEGVELPAGAVTGMEWYRRGKGLVAWRDIDAATGGTVEHFVLAELSTAGDSPARSGMALAPNVPNPFNPRTTISFTLQERQAVSLMIYDCRGRCVRRLLSGETREMGTHQESWDGLDDLGRALPSGVYACRLESDGAVRALRMTLLR